MSGKIFKCSGFSASVDVPIPKHIATEEKMRSEIEELRAEVKRLRHLLRRSEPWIVTSV